MSQPQTTRRDFLQTSAAAASAAVLPLWVSPNPARAFASPNERPVIGCIGTGSRWGQIVNQAMNYGDVATVCDVDAGHANAGAKRCRDTQGKKGDNRTIDIHEDYRKVLERDDVDVVTIVTPDHWHSKIAIEAMQAGKDIYCEKPLTLTIDEGRKIIGVLDETKRIFQVGTQQRSEYFDSQKKLYRFLHAVALVREGRIGKVKRVTCAIGGSSDSGPIPKADVPEGLNWEKWLGQAPLVDFRYAPGGTWGKTRCHYEFRWWYEYSGGKMTDWGAHHVDIAQWAIGMENSGPVSVEGTATHPCEFRDGHPVQDDRYNAATEFNVTCMFPNGVEMIIRHDTKNGITFEGEKGSFYCGRSGIEGEPVDDLKTNPLPEDALTKLYKGNQPGNHMFNFFHCVKERETPVSDVHTHHRAMTTCHLANIAIRLGRRIEWDPKAESIVGDDDAKQWEAREQRKGYELNV
ncbi:MAG: Gfo/Idh/MocA family oxidoreductase [Planctomycetaceae bacterium]|nr:Gfo/Idh/MocA family oxidoreductase [Planctomycetaceae bacterium]